MNLSKYQTVNLISTPFQQCLPFFSASINKLGDSPLRQVIHQLGDWPVLTANWTEENVTLVELHRRLRQKGLLDDMLLSITIVPSDKNNSQNILGVSDLQLSVHYQ